MAQNCAVKVVLQMTNCKTQECQSADFILWFEICALYFAMLSPEERRLIISILALLMLGAVVRSYRNRVHVENTPAVNLPSVDEIPASKTEERRE